MSIFPSDRLSMLQGYTGPTISQITSLSALNPSSSGSPVPQDTIGSVNIPVSSQEYLTNNIGSNPLIFGFDGFPHSDDIQGLHPAITGDYGTISQIPQSQPAQPQWQYQVLLPSQTQAQAQAQSPLHLPLYQDQQQQQLSQLSSLKPSTTFPSCFFTSSQIVLQKLQQAMPQFQSQQAFLAPKNDFIGPKYLTCHRYYGTMFDQPILESVFSSLYQSYLDVAIEEYLFTTPSGSPHVSLPNSFAGLELSNVDQDILMSIDSSRMNPAGQGVLMSAPMDSSTLKQQQQDSGCISDYSDLAKTSELMANAKRKKRVRKPSKTKAPPQILPCHYPNCDTICSSHPSLSRHYETHKWRGQYSPMRCEACQGSHSNKYSVQRHILRSPETSRCRKMRIYSIMKSETDIDSTVRFYPEGPHGKKTVEVDLEKMRAKYFNNN